MGFGRAEKLPRRSMVAFSRKARRYIKRQTARLRRRMELADPENVPRLLWRGWAD